MNDPYDLLPAREPEAESVPEAEEAAPPRYEAPALRTLPPAAEPAMIYEAPALRTVPLGALPGAPDDEAPRPHAAPGHGWRSLLHEMVETLLLTLLIFVVIQAFVQNYRIEGYSMEPTLHEGQRLFVDKISYIAGDPQRGDIIVLLFPKGDPNGPEEDYIKRIIGLPGDTVECRPGQIIVNGQIIAEPYLTDANQSSCPPTVLGPDQYFVMGDNRNASSDSRAWGPLDRRYIIGRAWVTYWPFEQAGLVPNYPLTVPPPANATAP